MANTLGATLGENISMSVLDHLVERIPPLMRFYISFGGDRVKKGEVITSLEERKKISQYKKQLDEKVREYRER